VASMTSATRTGTTTLGSDVLFPICAPGRQTCDPRGIKVSSNRVSFAGEGSSQGRPLSGGFERGVLRLRPAMEQVTSDGGGNQVVAAGSLAVSGRGRVPRSKLELKARLLASPPTDGLPHSAGESMSSATNRRHCDDGRFLGNPSWVREAHLLLSTARAWRVAMKTNRDNR